jgi:NTP pyrophosphatase (non-canonical NTP hydrolase)
MENFDNYIKNICRHVGVVEKPSVTKSVIQDMLTKFGEDSQIDVAIEEMSELIKELIKYKRSKIHFREKQAASREHVVEEIGDVMFMMEYLKAIFCISDDEIKNIIALKAVRTKERYLDV